MPCIDSSMNHDCIGSLGSIPNEPKRTLNVHLQEEICKCLADLSKKKIYLQHYWYDLKYLTHVLHAVY